MDGRPPRCVRHVDEAHDLLELETVFVMEADV